MSYTFHINLWQRDNGRWEATLEGKMAPLVRPVPGNTRPATAAQWRTVQDAIAGCEELLGHPVKVVWMFRRPAPGARYQRFDPETEERRQWDEDDQELRVR